MEQEKPFDMVSIVFLVLISATSDISDMVTGLIVAMPVVDQVAYFGNAFLVSPVAWAIIQGWFIMKVGFSGKVGIMNLAGGVANVIGLPVVTGTTLIAVYLANNPKLGGVATTIATTAVIGAVTGGTGAVARGGTTVATRGAAAGATRGAAAETTGTTRTAGVSEASTAGKTAAESKKAKTAMEAGGRRSREILGESSTPFEELQELTEKPLPEEESEEEEYA